MVFENLEYLLNLVYYYQKSKYIHKHIYIFQYNSHIKDLSVEKGDSVEVRVRHNMKREILHGIMDIGIQLNKK